MKYKKSQMEVLGLTVIIILMAVAMLFVVGKMVNRVPSDTRESYLDKQMAANMLNAILKTSSGDDCRGADFTELFQDCAENNPGFIRCTGGITSCDYLEKEINNTILNNTIVKWRKPHQLIATLEGQDEPVLDLSYKECSPDSVGPIYDHIESRLSPIPTDRGTLNIEFKICS